MKIYKLIVAGLLIALMNSACAQKSVSSDEAQLQKQEDVGLKSAYQDVNGLNFHYLEKGAGDVILFLHGFPFSSDTWIPLMEQLSDQYKTVAIDGRGYARSDKPEAVEDYHIEHLVADVAGFIQAKFPGQKVVLVGHDWGGTLGWTVAQNNPELVEKLVVVNAPPYNVFLQMLSENESQRKGTAYIPNLKSQAYEDKLVEMGAASVWNFGLQPIFEKGLISEAFKTQFFESWNQPGSIAGGLNWYRANVPDFDAIGDADYWPSKDARVTVPSLLIWADGEVAFVEDTFNKIPEFVDDLQVQMIENAGHIAHLEKTDEVVNHIRQFITSDE